MSSGLSGGRGRASRTAFFLAMALAFPAVAKPPSANAAESGDAVAQAQAAEALYRQAIQLMDGERYEEACEKFAASEALEPGVGTLLYLGDCYERLGRFASALATFEDASRLATERADEQRRHLASVRAAALEPRAPTLEIRTRPTSQLDLQITVNGVPIQRLDLNRAVRRDEGQYEIRVSAVGHAPFVARVVLNNGQIEPVLVTVPRLAPLGSATGEGDAAAAPVDRAPAGSAQRTVAWIVGGVGAALGATAGVMALLASGKNDDSRAACAPEDANRCGLDGVRLRDDARSLADLATLSGIVGVVAITGGVVLHVTAPDGSGAPTAAMITFDGAF